MFASVWVIVLERFCDRLSVEAWLAVAPAGMDIIIAMENPNAIMTSSERTFLLEMFLIALVAMPILARFQSFVRRRLEELGFMRGGFAWERILFAATLQIPFSLRTSLFRRLSLAWFVLLLNGFSELYQNLFRIQNTPNKPRQLNYLWCYSKTSQESKVPSFPK